MPEPTPSRPKKPRSSRGPVKFGLELALAAVLTIATAVGMLAGGVSGRYLDVGVLAVAVAVAVVGGWPTSGHSALGAAAAFLMIETLADRLDASHLAEQLLLTAGVLGSVLAAGFVRGDKTRPPTPLPRAVSQRDEDPWVHERPGQTQLRAGTLAYEVERARRTGALLSVLAIRPDGDKAPPQLLDLIEEAIVGTMRVVDLIDRAGHSRFEVILPETGPEGARTVAERIRLRIDSTRPDERTGISVSIGVAAYPADGSDDVELAHAAVRALDRASELGGNRTVLYSVPAGAPRGWGLSASVGTTPQQPQR